jgi:polyisoprenoid-binding protein YceI
MCVERYRSRFAFWGLAVCLLAAGAAVPARAREKGRAHEVDAKASRITVKVGTATRLGHEHGVEGNLKSGTLNLGGGGELVFDMTSLTADNPEVRKRVGLESKPVSETEAEKVTETMRGDKVLDVAQYPTATYRITSITPLDKQAAGEPGAYRLEGTFNLHGTEQKLLVKARAERGDREGELKLTGTFTLRQTDFGIKPFSAAGGLARVADDLEVTGEFVLKPAGK